MDSVVRLGIGKMVNTTSSTTLSNNVLPMPRELKVSDFKIADYVCLTSMVREKDLIWTVGPTASITLKIPDQSHQSVALKFDVRAFVSPELLPQQSVDVFLGSSCQVSWQFLDGVFRKRSVVVRRSMIPSSGLLTLSFAIPTCAKPSALGLNADSRELGFAISRIEWEPIADEDAYNERAKQYGRNVGKESRKSFDDKVDAGFWCRYITGPSVLDIGFKGYGRDNNCVVPVVEHAIGVDLDYPGYDGRTLPFHTQSQDAVYSSHCLEHIPNYVRAIQEWHRVTKVGGHIITIVPSAHLYERKRRPPSKWNADHQRFYTAQSLLREFEEALEPNSYRVRHLAENDQRYDYNLSSDTHPVGCYEIELVIEKIKGPRWSIES